MRRISGSWPTARSRISRAFLVLCIFPPPFVRSADRVRVEEFFPRERTREIDLRDVVFLREGMDQDDSNALVEEVEQPKLPSLHSDAELVDSALEVVSVGSAELMSELRQPSKARAAPRIRAAILRAESLEPLEGRDMASFVLGAPYLHSRQRTTSWISQYGDTVKADS